MFLFRDTQKNQYHFHCRPYHLHTHDNRSKLSQDFPWQVQKYQKVHSDNIKHVRDSLIMDGDYTEGNCTWENMRFHTKAVHSGKLWITYTLVLNKEFEDSLQRMISIIDQWNPTEC